MNLGFEIKKIEGKGRCVIATRSFKKGEIIETCPVITLTPTERKHLEKTLMASIHGNKNQNQRQRALEDFKSNYVQVLLATDVASRGIDINDVTHVINYDQPESVEDYIHRIGRTGRAGKTGTALTFID